MYHQHSLNLPVDLCVLAPGVTLLIFYIKRICLWSRLEHKRIFVGRSACGYSNSAKLNLLNAAAQEDLLFYLHYTTAHILAHSLAKNTPQKIHNALLTQELPQAHSLFSRNRQRRGAHNITQGFSIKHFIGGCYPAGLHTQYEGWSKSCQITPQLMLICHSQTQLPAHNTSGPSVQLK